MHVNSQTSFYRRCLDCQHFSFGWADDQRCASCGSSQTVAVSPEEAHRCQKGTRMADHPSSFWLEWRWIEG